MPISLRDHAILRAEKYITSGAYILDTETTGLGDSAEIVEIAIIRADGTILLNRLVKPSRPIPAAATAIHGITDADVNDAPTWPELWPQVKAIISHRTVIAYNAPFDQDMIAQSCGAYPTLIQEPVVVGARWADLMELWRMFIDVDHRISLANACAAASIPLGAHRALADAEAARKLLHFIANQPLEV